MSRELLKEVLRVLQEDENCCVYMSGLCKEIEEELAKPEPEPLCYLSNKVGTTTFEQCEADHGPPNKYWTSAIPVYKSPMLSLKPLSNDEINKIGLSIIPWSGFQFARAIEKAHGIGES